MKTCQIKESWRTAVVRRVVLFAVILLAVCAGSVRAQDAPLGQALAAYKAAEYDKAMDLFSHVATDATADKDVRKEALQYLGRIYIAKSLYDQARQAITQLLDLEPPLVELDPDMYPPPLMNLYYEVRKDYEERHDGAQAAYVVQKEDPGMRTLAVMDFRNYAMNDRERYDPMQWGFSSMMIEQLSGAVDLKLVDRENIKWLLSELDLQKDPSRVDQETAVRMGKLLGAHAMVFGGIYFDGKKMRLSARVVKVETGEILLGESVEGKDKEFYDLLEKLSLKIAQALNSTVTQNEIGARTETKSLDAMLSYSQGIGKLDQGDYRGAYEKFMEALDYDPSYIRARNRAESLRPMLAVASEGNSSSSGGPGR